MRNGIELIMTVSSFVMLVAIVFMIADERDALKKEAVERGYAEWIGKSNGSTTWQWKEVAK